ncbi:hypothetical protein LTR27_001891 [Elasticomyces elasticus]|nr:hypothetical protein LTR27_001891 [Elasticomyces elasticus]
MKISTRIRASDGSALRSLILYPLGSLVAVTCFTAAFHTVLTHTDGLKDTSAPYPNSEKSDVYCPGSTSPQFTFRELSLPGGMLWDPRLFLTITLGFGRFTFAQAKALDFAWDLIVGSGGQALAVTLVYPLFRRMLLAHMEGCPVPMQAYKSIAFDGIAVVTFWNVFHGWPPHRSPNGAGNRYSAFSARQRTRNWFFWLGALSVFAYLLAFGKVLSLMTGYQAIAGPVVTSEGNLINVSDVFIRLDWFFVQDGSRIGLQDRYLVKPGDPNWTVLHQYAQTIEGSLSYQFRSANDTLGCNNRWSGPPEDSQISNKSCVFFAAPLGEPEAVWSNLTLNRTGTLQTTTLSTPLNMTGVVTNRYGSDFFFTTSVGVDQVGITLDYLYKNTKCLPTADYEWGFSSLLLFVFCVASILFFLVLQSMAWLVYDRSRSDRLRHPINVYQDAFDIVQELKDAYGGDLDAAGIKKKVRKEGTIVSLDLEGLPESRHTERQRAGRVGSKARSALSRIRRKKDSKGLIVTSTHSSRFGDFTTVEETIALRPSFHRHTSSATEGAVSGAESPVHKGGNEAQRVQPSQQPAAAPYTHLNVYEGT